MPSRKPHFVVNAPGFLQPDVDKISTQCHHPLKSAYRAAARDKALEQQREFGCGVHTVKGELIYIQRHVHDFHYSSQMLKTKVIDAEQKKNKEVGFGLKLIYHHHPLIKAEYSNRNTVFGAKKLGLSLNSFAVATRRWPTCDHHHHPLISAERQSINARLRELGVKRLALSAPCSLRSQPDGS